MHFPLGTMTPAYDVPLIIGMRIKIRPRYLSFLPHSHTHIHLQIVQLKARRAPQPVQEGWLDTESILESIALTLNHNFRQVLRFNLQPKALIKRILVDRTLETRNSPQPFQKRNALPNNILLRPNFPPPRTHAIR